MIRTKSKITYGWSKGLLVVATGREKEGCWHVRVEKGAKKIKKKKKKKIKYSEEAFSVFWIKEEKRLTNWRQDRDKK